MICECVASGKMLCQQVCVAQDWRMCRHVGISRSRRTGWIKDFPGFGGAVEEVIGHHVSRRGDRRFGCCGVFLRGFLLGRWAWWIDFPERSPAWRPTPAEGLRGSNTWINCLVRRERNKALAICYCDRKSGFRLKPFTLNWELGSFHHPLFPLSPLFTFSR